MKVAGLLAVLALALVPSTAMADDPNDPDMRDPRNRARDRAIIKQMNLDQLAYVRKRDAGYARQRGANARRQADYAQARARHDQDMAAWRRAVAMCRSGHYEYCDR